jgi:iron complex outermembrane recepter protein
MKKEPTPEKIPEKGFSGISGSLFKIFLKMTAFLRSSVGCFAISLIGLSAHELAAQPVCSFVLEGQLNMVHHKAPISFAQITVIETGKRVLSTENGTFAISGLCANTYTLEIKHLECKHTLQQVVLTGNTQVSLQLEHDNTDLKSVVVTEKRLAAVSTQNKGVLAGEALKAQQGQVLGEMLTALPGISTLNTGGTVSKPVIQGLHSDRIQILNNGVRHEGQQWGADHAPEIDPFAAEKIEVLKGAAAVRYGLGAMGGVILIEPRALRDSAGSGQGFALVGASNGWGGSANAFFEQNLGKWAYRIQATTRKMGDLATPTYNLSNTGVEELGGHATLGFKHKKQTFELFYSHFYTKIGIMKGSHIGNLTDLKEAIRRAKPEKETPFSYEIQRPAQQVSHDLLKLKYTAPTKEIGKIEVILNGQYNKREEFDAHRLGVRKTDPLTRAEVGFELPSLNLRTDWTHTAWKNCTGEIGLEAQFLYNNTFSSALLPNYRQLTNGFYVLERWKKFPLPLEIELGVRFDKRNLYVFDRKIDGVQTDTTLDFQSTSANLGLSWQVFKTSKMNVNLAQAWRNPNVNELFSLGVHHGTASFERGNPQLLPEISTQMSLGFQHKGAVFALDFSVFRNQIRRFIYLKPEKTPVLTIRGVFPAFAYTQTDAVLQGGDFTLLAQLTPQFSYALKGATVWAFSTETRDFLPLMPPDAFEHNLKYELPELARFKNTQLRLAWRQVLKQNRIPTDSDDFAPPPAAYSLLNVALTTDVYFWSKKFQIGLDVTNVLNTAFRNYMDRLRYYSDAPQARGVVLRLTTDFTNIITAR